MLRFSQPWRALSSRSGMFNVLRGFPQSLPRRYPLGGSLYGLLEIERRRSPFSLERRDGIVVRSVMVPDDPSDATLAAFAESSAQSTLVLVAASICRLSFEASALTMLQTMADVFPSVISDYCAPRMHVCPFEHVIGLAESRRSRIDALCQRFKWSRAHVEESSPYGSWWFDNSTTYRTYFCPVVYCLCAV